MNNDRYEEPEINDYISTIPTISQMLGYTMSDKMHDSLMRCHDCGIKHSLHELTRIRVGYFVCKFCLRKGA